MKPKSVFPAGNANPEIETACVPITPSTSRLVGHNIMVRTPQSTPMCCLNRRQTNKSRGKPGWTAWTIPVNRAVPSSFPRGMASRMKLRRAHIILVDISGYTQFIRLHRMSVIHAERIITDLIEAVIDAAGPPLILNKLEGDAALFYALAGEDQAGREHSAAEVLGQIQGFFQVFTRRERELVSECTLCLCDACAKSGELKLKVIAHTGDILIKQVRQFEEIAGEDVILAHRLLKNSIPADEYLLLTDAFHALSGPPEGMPLVPLSEECAVHGRIMLHVHQPSGRPVPGDLPPANLWRRVKTTLRLERHLLRRLLGATGGKFHHLPAPPPGGDLPA